MKLDPVASRIAGSLTIAFGKEATEARIRTDIHDRFDIDAGQEVGRKVAEKVLARGFVARMN